MIKKNIKKGGLPSPKITFSRFNQIIFTLKEIIKLSFRVDPKLLIAVLILNSLWGLTSVPSFYIDKLLIDRLIRGLEEFGGEGFVNAILFLLILRVSLEFIRNVVGGYSGFLGRMLSRKMTNEMDVLIGEKVSSLDLATIEDPEFRDRFSKIERESGRRAWGLMMPISNIPSYIFGFVSSLGLLFFLNPLVLVGIILFALPSFFIDKKYIKKEYELYTELSPLHRIWGWLSYYLTQNRNFMEMKILNLSTYLAKKLRGIQEEENNRRISFEKARVKSRFLSFVPLTMFDFGVSFWISYLVILKKISVGSFQMYLRALANAQQNLTGLVSSFLEIYENYIYVTDLVWLLGLKPTLEEIKEGRKPRLEKVTGIKFQDVWFRYPRSNQWIIKGVNFQINKGEKIAIVGENGAGKSTLIKLLGRFYDPQKGKIFINDVDIKDINIYSWWKKLAVLFQEFELYPFTAREAIGFGDVENINDLDRIKEAAKKAGIVDFIESLPLKYENPITPEFEKGVRPSIGQWQRFGIARVLFKKDADLLVLDEPTSNVDPEAEEKIFQELIKITKDKILIFVTQRFSTVRIADRIFVVDKGKIIEQGTHSELMSIDGKYKRLFTLQAQAYLENNQG